MSSKYWLTCIRRLNADDHKYAAMSTERLAQEIEQTLALILETEVQNLRYYLLDSDALGMGQEGLIEFLSRLKDVKFGSWRGLMVTKVENAELAISKDTPEGAEYWMGDVTSQDGIKGGDRAITRLWARLKENG